MTTLEKDILNILTQDARIAPSKIAAMLSVDETEVKACIKGMEESGAIVKYTAIINAERAGRKAWTIPSGRARRGTWSATAGTASRKQTGLSPSRIRNGTI